MEPSPFDSLPALELAQPPSAAAPPTIADAELDEVDPLEWTCGELDDDSEPVDEAAHHVGTDVENLDMADERDLLMQYLDSAPADAALRERHIGWLRRTCRKHCVPLPEWVNGLFGGG